jgi:hypothetical protein
MNKLDTSYNPEARQILNNNQASEINDAEAGRANEVVDEVMCLLIDKVKVDKEDDKSESKYDEPKSFQQVWNHPDPFQRDKWREAICKAFHDMIKRGVWRKTS